MPHSGSAPTPAKLMASYITVEFIGPDWKNDLQSAFVKASDDLSTLIFGDVYDVAFADGTVLHDLIIRAEMITIDGQFCALGRAGPAQARNGNSVDDGSPMLGLMEYDSADAQWRLDSGNLASVVVHELMHTLSFGAMWGFHGVIESCIATGDLICTGENAVTSDKVDLTTQGADAVDSRSIALEMDGGSGDGVQPLG